MTSVFGSELASLNEYEWLGLFGLSLQFLALNQAIITRGIQHNTQWLCYEKCRKVE